MRSCWRGGGAVGEEEGEELPEGICCRGGSRSAREEPLERRRGKEGEECVDWGLFLSLSPSYLLVPTTFLFPAKTLFPA